jgi:hypothetical protein
MFEEEKACTTREGRGIPALAIRPEYRRCLSLTLGPLSGVCRPQAPSKDPNRHTLKGLNPAETAGHYDGVGVALHVPAAPDSNHFRMKALTPMNSSADDLECS